MHAIAQHAAQVGHPNAISVLILIAFIVGLVLAAEALTGGPRRRRRRSR